MHHHQDRKILLSEGQINAVFIPIKPTFLGSHHSCVDPNLRTCESEESASIVEVTFRGDVDKVTTKFVKVRFVHE